MMDRRSFLGSLLGLVAGSQALARFNPAVTPAKLIPPVQRPPWVAFEFLRELIDQTGIPARLLSADEWRTVVGVRQTAVSFQLMHFHLPIDQLAETTIRPAAAAMAEYLIDEQKRGARGLAFCSQPMVREVELCQLVSAPEAGYSVRYIEAINWQPGADEDCLLGRFDACYAWDKSPLRRKHSFRSFDPRRLPA